MYTYNKLIRIAEDICTRTINSQQDPQSYLNPCHEQKEEQQQHTEASRDETQSYKQHADHIEFNPPATI